MTDLEFLPNTPTLMNAGRELGQLSACFVLPVGDSMDSIFEAVKNTALIHKSGGGTGFSFSRLRPKNDLVLSTKGVSSGPLSFMSVFDAATETIKQGGTRRGANMGILRVDHPDILDFITAKQDDAKLNNFNISVAVTDAFMHAVDEDGEYALVNPRTGETVKHAQGAQGLQDHGHPRLEERRPRHRLHRPHQRGQPHAAARRDREHQPLRRAAAAAVRVVQPRLHQPLQGGARRARRLRRSSGASCARAVRFLDNVIDVNHYPLPQIEEMTKGNRKIGLGVMGFADMLLQLGVPYDSDEALQDRRRDHELRPRRGARRLGRARRRARRLPQLRGLGLRPARRRAGCATRPRRPSRPTGTISIIAGCSSGIEPLFAVSYVRANVLDDESMVEVHPHFEEVARARGFYSDELMKKIAEKGTVRGTDGVPDDVQAVFATAHDITPEWHIKLQAAFQKHTDNAVSKTVNFPNAATVDDVEKVYLLAFKSGCKGVTIYRDGSREEQVLNVGQTVKKKEPGAGIATTRPSRPQLLTGETQRMETGCGKLFVIMNDDEYGAREVFANMGKAGGCASSNTEALGRLISLALKKGASASEIVEQLKGIRCHVPYGMGPNATLSCADAIGKALERRYVERRRRGGGGRPRAAALAGRGRPGRLPRLRRLDRARGRVRGVPAVRLLKCG